MRYRRRFRSFRRGGFRSRYGRGRSRFSRVRRGYRSSARRRSPRKIGYRL